MLEMQNLYTHKKQVLLLLLLPLLLLLLLPLLLPMCSDFHCSLLQGRGCDGADSSNASEIAKVTPSSFIFLPSSPALL